MLGLARADGVPPGRGANRFDRRLGQADASHLSFAHQIRHCTYGVLDRRVPVDAMLIVEIDGVHPQSLERTLARLSNIFRLSVDTAFGRVVRIAHVAEFGRENNPVTLAFDRAAND